MNSSNRKWWIIGCVVLAGLCLCGITVVGIGAALVIARGNQTSGLPSIDFEEPIQVLTAIVATVEVLPIPTIEAPLATEVPLPTEAVNPAKTPAANLETVSFEGITFSYDPALAQSVTAEVVEEQSGDNIPPWDVMPRHVRFTFEGYPREGETMHTAEIIVLPIVDYILLDERVQPVFTELAQALATHPTQFDNGAPFLPFFNAAQMINAQVRYLNDNTGMRYVTQFGQAAGPINNQYVIYTYQGIASGGLYYVSAIFPVSSAILPDTADVTDYQAFENNFVQYLAETRDALNAEPAANFSPNLELLDALMQSIAITQ